ncbi:hypothetical protein RJT34_00113 [Clitoria ternatea]|uniref:Uncharacterized protein n=1 Tax=Clitoria ternatea TaxID=43366 RepID=A0AAN9KGC1_CLITE
MDVKALAKSKRSHTQHHNKKGHHSHKFKAPSPSSSTSSSPASNDSAKHLLGTQQLNDDKKPRRSQFQGSSALPNNWDRYEEEEEELESGSEIASKNVAVALPKSKGADFRHLVAEAEAEAEARAETSLGGFPSLDDLLPGEFGEGLSSMLVVRGEGIVSWVGDDNFVVEDRTSGNPEASFMSLNLHALAESLDKVDLSKRLFIESDLLPSELTVNEEHQELEAKEHSELANRMSKELSLDDFAAEDQFTSSSSSSTTYAASTFALSNNSLVPVINAKVELQKVGNSGKNKAFSLNSEANVHSTEDMRGGETTFEAATAEDELDMLLDSLSETKILHSPSFNSNTTFPVSLGDSSVFPPQISKKDPAPSHTAIISASLDETLDDLLEETSSLMNPNVLVRQQEEKPVHHSISSSSHSGSKSKVLDDFDSWFDTL